MKYILVLIKSVRYGKFFLIQPIKDQRIKITS